MNIKSIITFALISIGVLVGVTALLWNFGAKPKQVTQISEVAGTKRLKKGEGQVTVTEFSDFQCPACKSVQDPLKQVLAKYEGKVIFIYRYFPLTSIHKNAMISAQAAEAANIQGKFWEMHDLLFTRQSEWAELPDPKEKFAIYAEELKLDKARFLSDLVNSQTKDVISMDMADANKFKVQATPTFFVNGYETDFAQLEPKIQEFLK